MRVISILPLFVALVSAVGTPTIQSRTDCYTEICGTLDTSDVPSDFVERSVASAFSPALSNAERLSKRLPLKPPHRRRAGARRATPSPVPIPVPTLRGYIKVSRSDTHDDLGFISHNMFSGAQYRYQDISNALIVHFEVPDSTTTASQIDLYTENSDVQAAFTRIGLVQGRDDTNSDMGPGSFNYLYIASTDPTPTGSPPQSVGNSYTTATGTSRSSESAVWSFDPTSYAVTLQWINSNGAAATLATFTQSTALYAGGDATAFVARYPSPVFPTTYTFVPI